MTNRLRFGRNAAGTFDLSEPKIARLTAQLRPRVGQAGPLIPETFMRAACTELRTCGLEL